MCRRKSLTSVVVGLSSQLVELGLLHEEEKQKMQRDHEAEVGGPSTGCKLIN